MIRIAIVDDNNFYVNDIKKLLAECIESAEFQVDEYLSGDEFLGTLSSLKYDIVFLDIVLGLHSGIDIGIEVNQQQPDANIIFVSSHPEYFEDVYRVSHSYFLTKDFDKERFADAVSKAVKSVRKNIIVLQVKNDRYRVDLNDVLYFEGYMKHTRIHFKNGDEAEYSINLRAVEEQLDNDEFIRSHQSYILNLRHVKRYNRQQVFFDFDKSIPVSRTHINTVREKITLFLGGVL